MYTAPGMLCEVSAGPWTVGLFSPSVVAFQTWFCNLILHLSSFSCNFCLGPLPAFPVSLPNPTEQWLIPGAAFLSVPRLSPPTCFSIASSRCASHRMTVANIYVAPRLVSAASK